MKNKETSKTNKKTSPKETVWDEELISRDEMNGLNEKLEKKVEFKL